MDYLHPVRKTQTRYAYNLTYGVATALETDLAHAHVDWSKVTSRTVGFKSAGSRPRVGPHMYNYAMTPSLAKKSSVVFAIALCAACGTADDKPSDASSLASSASSTAGSAPTKQLIAQSAAESLRRSIPQVVRLIVVTEDNDGNNLIGRPNGYSAATALVDSRLPACQTPGADCGAMIEQWPDTAAAQRRVDYIQTIARAAPALANEYDTVKGNLLLRVAGDLKPSAAEVYKRAFTE